MFLGVRHSTPLLLSTMSKPRKKSPPQKKQSSSQKFVVDAIVNKVDVNGQSYYLVVWKGFDKKDATWECFDNVRTASFALDNYEKGVCNGTMPLIDKEFPLPPPQTTVVGERKQKENTSPPLNRKRTQQQQQQQDKSCTVTPIKRQKTETKIEKPSSIPSSPSATDTIAERRLLLSNAISVLSHFRRLKDHMPIEAWPQALESTFDGCVKILHELCRDLSSAETSTLTLTTTDLMELFIQIFDNSSHMDIDAAQYSSAVIAVIESLIPWTRAVLANGISAFFRVTYLERMILIWARIHMSKCPTLFAAKANDLWAKLGHIWGEAAVMMVLKLPQKDLSISVAAADLIVNMIKPIVGEDMHLHFTTHISTAYNGRFTRMCS